MRGARAQRYTPAIFLAVSLFFLWGVANNLNDILIAHFRRVFTLTDFETSYVQQVFYVGYFCFAIPAATLARRRGYKAAIVTGLVLYGIGALLFYPSTRFGEYGFFLAALFVIASGLAFLETAANPLIATLGDPAGAARRLTLAQAANPIGTIAGVLIGKQFILSHLVRDPEPAGAAMGDQLAAVQLPYLAIGIVTLTLAAIAAIVRFPPHRTTGDVPSAGVAAALRHPRLRFAVIAQFFYVGAQVGLWSYTIRYVQANVPGTTEDQAADYLFAGLVLFGIGRFAGSALMTRIDAAPLLAAYSAVSAVLTLVAALAGGSTGLYALVAASFFMSIQFPAVFALGLEVLDDEREAGASLIVMAIIGGAVLTGVMGHVSDRMGSDRALLVPAMCFAVVFAFAAWECRHRLARRRLQRASGPVLPRDGSARIVEDIGRLAGHAETGPASSESSRCQRADRSPWAKMNER